MKAFWVKIAVFGQIFLIFAKGLFRGNDCYNTSHPFKNEAGMIAITPLTTGFHEIIPLTMKRERWYKHLPLLMVEKHTRRNFGTTYNFWWTQSSNSINISAELFIFWKLSNWKYIKTIISGATDTKKCERTIRRDTKAWLASGEF